MYLDYFAINTSNKTLTIKDYPSYTNVIGRLYPREFCLRNDEDNGYVIFLSSSGTLKDGLIYDNDAKFTPISSLPYSREVIPSSGGKEYLIYKMRKTMNVYYGDGTAWGKVAAGMFVATDSCANGDDHRDWMKVKYVKRTDGEWIQVHGHGYEHGFVDTGFSTASGYNSIALYGNW